MIEITNLFKSFGSNHVLKGVNLTIYDGETITIAGPSGCGKTVLLKHILGLLKPDSGSIYVDGVDVTKLSTTQLNELQKKFGFVFQGCALFDSLTVYENVAFGLRNSNLPNFQKEQIVKNCLSHVGLQGKENLKPHELSGGMKKRVALARAIAYNPKYLLYDEPTTGLDPLIADTITDLIIHLQKTLNISSIIVTHDLKCAFKVSNRVAMLHNGKIIEISKPEEFKNSQNPFIRKFIETAL